MLAAQNSLELPWTQLLEQLAKLISMLPPGLAALTVLALVATVGAFWGAPRLLRALDNRRVAKKVCEQITTERGALEALRITRSNARSRLSLPRSNHRSADDAGNDGPVS